MHVAMSELEAGLAYIKESPKVEGTVELIVCRPNTNEREVLSEGELCVEKGLIGDNWFDRGYKKRADGSAHPDMQINIMNARVANVLAVTKERWPLAGDQFYVDFDLSKAHVPPGTRLAIGEAVLEVTEEPHLGCKKFKERYGKDAVLYVNSEEGKALNLRGINAKVVKPGAVKQGAVVKIVNE